MIRSELVALLQQHRDNDVKVYVPFESGGACTLGVQAVNYSPEDDVLLIDVEMVLDAEEAPDA